MRPGSILEQQRDPTRMHHCRYEATAAKLDAVLALLPSLNSPTVAPLQNGEWLSLETVVSTGIVRDLIPQLREAGAEGILEYALNKVI